YLEGSRMRIRVAAADRVQPVDCAGRGGGAIDGAIAAGAVAPVDDGVDVVCREARRGEGCDRTRDLAVDHRDLCCRREVELPRHLWGRVEVGAGESQPRALRSKSSQEVSVTAGALGLRGPADFSERDQAWEDHVVDIAQVDDGLAPH